MAINQDYIQKSSDGIAVNHLEDSIIYQDDANSRIGIGTTSPEAKFEVIDTALASGQNQVGRFMTNADDGQGVLLGYMADGTHASGGFIRASNNNKLLLNPYGGNVGVGVTNPSVKLEVNGAGKFSGQLDMNSNKVVNVTDPTANQDAATKNYVDTHIASDGGWTHESGRVYLTNSTDSVGIGTNLHRNPFDDKGYHAFFVSFWKHLIHAARPSPYPAESHRCRSRSSRGMRPSC